MSIKQLLGIGIIKYPENKNLSEDIPCFSNGEPMKGYGRLIYNGQYFYSVPGFSYTPGPEPIPPFEPPAITSPNTLRFQFHENLDVLPNITAEGKGTWEKVYVYSDTRDPEHYGAYWDFTLTQSSWSDVFNYDMASWKQYQDPITGELVSYGQFSIVDNSTLSSSSNQMGSWLGMTGLRKLRLDFEGSSSDLEIGSVLFDVKDGWNVQEIEILNYNKHYFRNLSRNLDSDEPNQHPKKFKFTGQRWTLSDTMSLGILTDQLEELYIDNCDLYSDTWPLLSFSDKSALKKVYIGDQVWINSDRNFSNLFEGCTTLEEFRIGEWARNVTAWNSCFKGCTSLQDVNTIIIGSGTKDMQYLFFNCQSGLKNVSLEFENDSIPVFDGIFAYLAPSPVLKIKLKNLKDCRQYSSQPWAQVYAGTDTSSIELVAVECEDNDNTHAILNP